MLKNIPENLDIIQAAGDKFREAIKQAAIELTVPAKTTICHQGNTCEHLPIVLSGEARVYKLSENGREITLYRINEGESCVLTASCIMSGISFPAIAVTETESKAILIPQQYVVSWFDEYAEWRRFIFEMVSRRMSDILTVIEEIAFQRMDTRLARHLLKKQNADNNIKATHQAIADELGTAREVVTRLLRDMESSGKINMQRGLITIIDQTALENLR